MEPVTFFVFASPEKLSIVQEREVLKSMDEFLENWKSHGVPVKARANIEYGHFLTVEILPGSVIPGGCSKDELFRKISELEKNFNIKLLDRKYLYVYDFSENIIPVSIHDFNYVKMKEERPDLKIFETHVTNVKEWKKNPVCFEKSHIMGLL